MYAKIIIFAVLLSALGVSAQTNPNQSKSDELLRHLSAAETFQSTGDLENAAIENRAVAGIALQRIGNILIEEGTYSEAIRVLSESILYSESALHRTNLATAYQRSGDLERAIAEARKAIAIDPEFFAAHYLLGNIYYTKGDYQSALPELERVFRVAPDFDAAYALGLTYLNLKQPERARLLFEELQISAGKPSAELHLLFAKAFERTNYPLEAERELKTALKLNPKHPRLNFFLGYLILQQGGSDRLNEAGAAFEEELKLAPNDFYSNFFIGVVASSENNHEKAIRFLQRAVELDGRRGEAFLFLAQSQIEREDLAGAEKSLRRAVELEGANREKDFQARRTHFLLGRVLVRTGRKEEGERELAIARELQEKSIQSARDEITQILGQVVGAATPAPLPVEQNTDVRIKLAPERAAELVRIKNGLSDITAQAFFNLGVIAVQGGRADEALLNFESASRWKADFPNLDRSRGIVAFRAGKFDRVVEPLRRHLAKTPGDALARRMLGASHYFLKDFAAAADVLKPIGAAIVNDAELAYFYGISLIQLKRNADAATLFGELARISQDQPDALFYAAQGFMILGDFERSVLEFRRVAAISPRLERTNYLIGQGLMRLNRFDEAEKAFARELEINPVDVLSKYHLALTFIERKTEPVRTITILEEAIALKSDYADARYQLGKIYLEKGETAKAVEQLELAVAADPVKDYIHYQLSIAYRRSSRKDDADRELKRYQELKAANRTSDSPMGNND